MGADLMKKEIKRTFLAMLNEKPLSQITVKQLVAECGIKEGTFDTITGCKYSIPSETSIGRVYSTLIEQTDEGDVAKTLRKVFGSFLSDEISDFANGVYYQNPSYLLESYKAGRLLK